MYQWEDRAACKGQPQWVFFPEPGCGTGEVAKLICAMCSVRSECLQSAIENREESGIWGGLNTKERHRFEDERARRTSHSGGRIRRAPVVAADALLTSRQIWTADG